MAALGLNLALAQECNNPQSVYGLFTSLGLGTLDGLGRLQPLTDFQVVNNRLALTAESEELCLTARDKCIVIKGMLKMQEDQYQSGDFYPSIYRERLVTQYYRQMVAAQRPATDPNRAWAAPHSIRQTGLSSGGCGGVYIHYRINSLTSEITTAAQLCSQMIYFGSQGTMSGDTCVADNPYLDISTRDYDSTGFTMLIDPPSFVNWSRETVADDIAACIYIDPTGTALGKSCECNGNAGTLQLFESETPVYRCVASAVAGTTQSAADLALAE
jgi:hypothetical protein